MNRCICSQLEECAIKTALLLASTTIISRRTDGQINGCCKNRLSLSSIVDIFVQSAIFSLHCLWGSCVFSSFRISFLGNLKSEHLIPLKSTVTTSRSLTVTTSPDQHSALPPLLPELLERLRPLTETPFRVYQQRWLSRSPAPGDVTMYHLEYLPVNTWMHLISEHLWTTPMRTAGGVKPGWSAASSFLTLILITAL